MSSLPNDFQARTQENPKEGEMIRCSTRGCRTKATTRIEPVGGYRNQTVEVPPPYCAECTKKILKWCRDNAKLVRQIKILNKRGH